MTRTTLAEIKDIDFSKITGYFGEHLLSLVGKPISTTYGERLRDLGIAQVQFYEQEYDYIGNPTRKILLGEVVNEAPKTTKREGTK